MNHSIYQIYFSDSFIIIVIIYLCASFFLNQETWLNW